MTLIQRAWAITLLPATTGIITAVVLGALCLDIEAEADAHSLRVLQLTTYTRLGSLYLNQLETLMYWCFAKGGTETVMRIKSLQQRSDAKLKTLQDLVKGDKELADIPQQLLAAHKNFFDSVDQAIPADPPEKLFLTIEQQKDLFGAYSKTRKPYQSMFDILTERSQKTVEAIEKRSSTAYTIVGFGFILNLFMCIILLHFFSRHVARRIGSLQRSAKVLASNQAIKPVLAGEDEIKRLEEKLVSLSKELTLARYRKQDFLAMVSHDLRSPLTSLGMSLEMFGKGVYGDISVEGRRGFRKHARNVDSLVTMISDLLDLEKIEANLLESNLKNTNLNELLSSFTSQISERLITDRIKPGNCVEPSEVICDRDQMEIALTRIISFCLFASEGDITVDTTSIDATSPITINIEAHTPIECGINKADPFNRFASASAASRSAQSSSQSVPALSQDAQAPKLPPLSPEHRHGLALAKQLTALNGHEIACTFEQKLFRFQLRLKRAQQPQEGS